jgi:hypothetical protein
MVLPPAAAPIVVYYKEVVNRFVKVSFYEGNLNPNSWKR